MRYKALTRETGGVARLVEVDLERGNVRTRDAGPATVLFDVAGGCLSSHVSSDALGERP